MYTGFRSSGNRLRGCGHETCTSCQSCTALLSSVVLGDFALTRLRAFGGQAGSELSSSSPFWTSYYPKLKLVDKYDGTYASLYDNTGISIEAAAGDNNSARSQPRAAS